LGRSGSGAALGAVGLQKTSDLRARCEPGVPAAGLQPHHPGARQAGPAAPGASGLRQGLRDLRRGRPADSPRRGRAVPRGEVQRGRGRAEGGEDRRQEEFVRPAPRAAPDFGRVLGDADRLGRARDGLPSRWSAG
ncbi:unnamed protein product, partial [Effrenium voratum]